MSNFNSNSFSKIQVENINDDRSIVTISFANKKENKYDFKRIDKPVAIYRYLDTSKEKVKIKNTCVFIYNDLA